MEIPTGCETDLYFKITPIPPPPTSLEFEVYFELLMREFAAPQFRSDLHLYEDSFVSQLKVDPAAYDNATWEFELIGWNNQVIDFIFEVIDTAETVCATITLPGTGIGDISDPAPEPTWELLRQRVPFVPTSDDTYRLRLRINELTPIFPGISYYGPYLYSLITVARLVCHQTAPNKTQLQIPMMSAYYDIWELIPSSAELPPPYYDPALITWPWDDPVGVSIFQTDANDYSDAIYGLNGSIWKYERSLLSTPKEVVLSVCARGMSTTTTTKTNTTYSSVPITSLRQMLYWAPGASSGNGCGTNEGSSATPGNWVNENQAHTCNDTGTVFTPFPDSLIESTGFPFSETVHPDLSGLAPGSYQLHIGGSFNYNFWFVWPKITTVIIPAGSSIQDVVFRIFFTDATHYTIIFSYAILPIDGNATLTVALYNITNSEVVSGSELVWTPFEGINRKYSDPIVLTDNCEYIVSTIGDKISGNYLGEMFDAQLLIKADPIDQLAIWYRVSNSGSDQIDDYHEPETWNHNGIESRVKLFLPPGATAYYEQTVNAYDSNNGGPLTLIDMGTEDATGNGGSDVDGATLTFPVSEDLVRKRSDALSLVDGNRYTVRNPSYDDEYLCSTNGFIIIKIN